jgi:hypothetical protein
VVHRLVVQYGRPTDPATGGASMASVDLDDVSPAG